MFTYRQLLLACFSLMTVSSVMAQRFDTDKPLQIVDRDEVKMKFGGRFYEDAALYMGDDDAMKSGATIADARVKVALEYGDNWLFYADFGFGDGKFSQKDIYMQYAKKSDKGAMNAIKVGHFFSPASSMEQIVSTGSLHYIACAGFTDAFSWGRELGATYKYSGKHLFAEQGAFVENKYNSQENGDNGYSLAGRWIVRDVKEHSTMHLGVSARYGHLGGGEQVYGYKKLKKTYTISQPLETYVDKTDSYVNAAIPWADRTYDLNAELLYNNHDIFLRGEYMHKWVHWAEPNYDARTAKFQGAYLEAGYQIFGGGYGYDEEEALLKGNNARTLEVVGRVSFTNLDNIENYTNIHIGAAAPAKTLEKLTSYTIGLNYAFNRYAQLMLSYTYHHTDMADNISVLQTRMQFVF